MMRFQNRQELDQARAAYKKALDLETKKILICAGTGCVAGGSLKIYDRFLELMQERGIRCEVRLEKEPHDESVGLAFVKWGRWSAWSRADTCISR